MIQSRVTLLHAASKEDEQSSLPAREKLSSGLPPSMMPLEHSAINTSSIIDNTASSWVKQRWPKTSAIGAHKGDLRQVTPLGKLKDESSVLDGSI